MYWLREDVVGDARGQHVDGRRLRVGGQWPSQGQRGHGNDGFVALGCREQVDDARRHLGPVLAEGDALDHHVVVGLGTGAGTHGGDEGTEVLVAGLGLAGLEEGHRRGEGTIAVVGFCLDAGQRLVLDGCASEEHADDLGDEALVRGRAALPAGPHRRRRRCRCGIGAVDGIALATIGGGRRIGRSVVVVIALEQALASTARTTTSIRNRTSVFGTRHL